MCSAQVHRVDIYIPVPFDDCASGSECDGGSTSGRLASLSLAHRDRQFDPVTFDVLKVAADELAQQITLLDSDVFRRIEPDELNSCGWTKRNKRALSPNVVALTRRFNHVCLWCQTEVLARPQPQVRAHVISQFVKVARRLVELRNLHSAFAVVSGLRSLPVHRLHHSWAAVPPSHKAAFEKTAKMFSEERNWERLRRATDTLKRPCVPYLGLYLTDMVYIDLAHPRQAGLLDGGQRSALMNNILRVLADMQHLQYDDIQPMPCVQSYLESIDYIDELQKFIEDDLYKKSLELEPQPEQQPNGGGGGGVPVSATAGAKCELERRDSLPAKLHERNAAQGGGGAHERQRKSVDANRTLATVATAGARLNCAALLTKKDVERFRQQQQQQEAINRSLNAPAAGSAATTGGHIKSSLAGFVRGHRKAHSLGGDAQFKFILGEGTPQQRRVSKHSQAAGAQQQQPSRFLLDDSLMDNTDSTVFAKDASLSRSHHASMPSAAACCVGDSAPAVDTADNAAAGDTTDNSASRVGTPRGGGRSSPAKRSTLPAMSNCSFASPHLARGTRAATVSFDVPTDVLFESAVRRKAVLRAGARPTLRHWTRYWMSCYSDGSLVLYAQRLAAGLRRVAWSQRAAYRVSAAKRHTLDGWMAVACAEARRPDMFIVQKPDAGYVYKLRAGSQASALLWVDAVQRAAALLRPPPPDNLISLD